MMKALFKSLRSRVFLCVLLAGLIPMIFLHLIVVGTYENRLIEERTIELKQRCNLIKKDLGRHQNIRESIDDSMVKTLSWYSEAYGGRLMVVDPLCRVLVDTYSVDIGKTCVSDVVFSAFQGREYSNFQKEAQFIEFIIPVSHVDNSESPQYIGALIFSSTTDWMQDGLSDVKRAMYILEIILFFVLIIVAIYVSYLVVRPIRSVGYELNKMSHGNVSARLNDIETYPEVQEITTASSEVIANYQKLEESQEQFVFNVSHELRTPMTSVRVLADSLLGQENVPEELYQEFLSDISVEIDRESHIIDDLLSMSKLNHDAEKTMSISNVNMNDFLMSILKTIRPIAEKRKIEIVYESFRQVHADIDEIKLGQAFINLVENAVKYNNDEGFVKVSLDADHEYFYVKIADNGVGIPEEALPHVFDRFYRVDKARSRETGGTGLGLSITKQIILLHYGIIKVESKEGEGTTFTIRIPLKHVEQSKGGKKK